MVGVDGQMDVLLLMMMMIMMLIIITEQVVLWLAPTSPVQTKIQLK